jgi:hypothetical protein
MKEKPWLNCGVAENEEEAEKLCNQWIGGGFYQETEEGKFNCFSLNELQQKIRDGEFD